MMKKSVFAKFASKKLDKGAAMSIKGGASWTCYRSEGGGRTTQVNFDSDQEAIAFMENNDAYSMCEKDYITL